MVSRLTRKKLARLASNIFNPVSLSLFMLALLSFHVTDGVSEALKWCLISASLSVIPVFIIILFLVRKRKLAGIFINIREQRHKIYIISCVFAAIDCVVLFLMKAPPALIATFVSSLAAVAVFMCINLRWKVSVHTGFAAAMVTILMILYGSIGAATAALVPIIAWSRVELDNHSLAQTITGAVLSSGISVIVFHSSGLLWV